MCARRRNVGMPPFLAFSRERWEHRSLVERLIRKSLAARFISVSIAADSLVFAGVLLVCSLLIHSSLALSCRWQDFVSRTSNVIRLEIFHRDPTNLSFSVRFRVFFPSVEILQLKIYDIASRVGERAHFAGNSGSNRDVGLLRWRAITANEKLIAPVILFFIQQFCDARARVSPARAVRQYPIN